ncbi:MAG: ABC transporter ATP-binding protein [Lachnospiraceae bacterium]|nr:ABC transporter ATP-binding protein [Lachnospiraceae bacterium]MCI8824312.1 ABC transporter ATP-binding protein [Lachnospiraceae bacterium]MCI9369393.1 ABC transporter ATP-binding protein [Lachnospiraceae bacterium]
MLSCNQLMKKYITTTAVQDITLKLEAGKTYALLGPNGSGKTTFMKMAAGLIKPTSGDIQFEGQNIGVYSKAHIAYMPTEAYFYPYMTCKDIGNYYHDFFEDFDIEKFFLILGNMDLNLNQKASKMSSGMMAKLKIAVTISRNARLIMLDEPLNGIDIIARERVLNTIINNFSPNKTFLISSHLVDELEQVIDYAIFIKRGHVELMGPADELRRANNKSIVDLYKEIYADCQF